MHIAACAKCLVARTRQQHHAHVLTRATVVKSTAHLPCGERCECVAIALAVNGDFGNAVKVLKQNFFKVETLNGLPFSLTHLYFSFKSFMRNAMACLQQARRGSKCLSIKLAHCKNKQFFSYRRLIAMKKCA